MREHIVPGSILEISYKCDRPVWFVANGVGADQAWLRGVRDWNTDVSIGYISGDSSTIQFKYDTLAVEWGDDWGETLRELQVEGADSWEVYSVKVGTDTGYAVLGSTYDVPGFSVKSDAWSQAGVAMTDEMREKIGPGTVIEIAYVSDGPVWLVANGVGADQAWLRGVPNWDTSLEASFGKFYDGRVQYLYDDLAIEWGADWNETLRELQAEGSESWEVISVTVGKPFQRMMNRTLIEGFAPKSDAWSQAGMEAEGIRNYLIPGAIFDLYYNSPGIIWFVANGVGPDQAWLRGVPEWNTDASASFGVDTGDKIQFTYDAFIPEWGADWGETLRELQVEGGEAWEVFSLYAGYLNY
jgi:hypothetical protein